MATNVHLTPELERFTRQCVDGGRYNNVSEVVRSALRLLQESEERRRQLAAILQAAETEADRDGTVSIDQVLAEIDDIIGANAAGLIGQHHYAASRGRNWPILPIVSSC